MFFGQVNPALQSLKDQLSALQGGLVQAQASADGAKIAEVTTAIATVSSQIQAIEKPAAPVAVKSNTKYIIAGTAVALLGVGAFLFFGKKKSARRRKR